MQGFIKSFLFVTLSGLCATAWSAPGVYATFTIDVTTLKMKDAVQGCGTIVPLKPDSSISIYYDDNSLVVNNIVTGNPYDQYGTWGELDGSFSRIRTDFTGSMTEGTGTWGSFLSGFEFAAQVSCPANVNAYGATFRVTRQETTFKIQPGACSGTGTTIFSMEGYGTHVGSSLPVKMTRQVQASGIVVLGPSGGC